MSNFAIIPQPASIRYTSGNFQCAGLPEINQDSRAVFQREAETFAAQIKQTCGESAAAKGSGCIRLITAEIPNAGGEAYRLEILPGEIKISAPAPAGIFHGLQSLRQIFLSEYHGGNLSIPCGVIEDHPRFVWRGLMLDCARTFFPVHFIKKIIDALSLHHISVFHWHLTDDQGWRIPVQRYPLLTEIGSKRRDHRQKDKVFGGYYTEDEIRSIVSFAAERHIDVVPELDLPGHASAILAAYPGLGCTGGPYRVEDRFGIFEDVLCAGNDEIFTLAEAVFDSAAELFPSKYVHIGGDEVRFNRWAECPKCQKRMRDLNLSAPGQLQSWITARLAAMLRERGKTAVGWDEVLENTELFPLPEDLVVMSWRGCKGGNEATALGRRVVMTPQSNGCYLDYRNFDSVEEMGAANRVSTIAQGYNLDPVTPEMDAKAASLVLGAQGNVWSEFIYAGKIAEYMIFPRICSLAETFWSRPDAKNIDEFKQRLEIHQRRLDRLGLLQYRGSLG